MDIQAELKWIHKELDDVDDPNLLEAIKNILQYRRKVKEDADEAFLEQYNAEIDEAEREIEAGEYYTTAEIRKMARQWGRE